LRRLWLLSIMSFHRKIANRILLANLAPLPFVLLIGVGLYFARSQHLHLLVGHYIGMLALGYVLGVVVARQFTHQYTTRLAQLRRGAERIEAGDYKLRLHVGQTRDELADVARAFNHMANVIAARESALREQNQVLAALNHRMESVLNATTDGIALLNREGRFALVNRRMCEMLGTRPEALIHQSFAEVQPDLIQSLGQPERLASRLAALTEDDLRDPIGVAEETIELTHPQHKFLQIYTAPVQGEAGDEVIGRIIALRDVTRERELDKMKTEFISVVSHELRTPLTSIKGYGDLLLSGAVGEMTELQSEFLGIIQAGTTRLTNLINDILDISRIESGRIELRHEPIDYRQIVGDTLRMMKASADEKQIRLEEELPDALPLVCGDADKVTQVLTNLVGNAIKYTPVGGWVRVTLEADGNTGVTTCVADSGIGIAPEDQTRLFQKFFRADNSTTREAGGTGLGLVIAKTIVELLGGAIWLESEPGAGSRFYFTLPLSPPEEAAPAAVPLPDRGIGLVLVVDDDAFVRGLIQHHLHRRGYGTIGAEGCADALQKARQHKPDVVTLDMMMPDMDGFRLLRALKLDRATATIPVVILSVIGDPARGDLSLGAFSFLQKPVDEQRLAETIVAALVSARGTFPSRMDVNGDAGPWARVLSVSPDTAAHYSEDALQRLIGHGIALTHVRTASDAITYTIGQSPDVLLIDMDLPEKELFDLISALKAEEEAARIPIVLLTEDIPDEGIHFHLGGGLAENSASLDYVCDQLTRVLERPEPVVNAGC
jgi:signal transduction histidine kinase/DNA-binding response OmpR family regulator/HAMP domain-containing protein